MSKVPGWGWMMGLGSVQGRVRLMVRVWGPDSEMGSGKMMAQEWEQMLVTLMGSLAHL
jgi:hypothetical protein